MARRSGRVVGRAGKARVQHNHQLLGGAGFLKKGEK